METDSIKWVGSPCGLHGAYIFYKAFKFSLEGRARILSLGDFFFVRCKPGAPICIAELQLLWEEKNNKQLLSSSKLYFLPEDTPEGRSIGHGEDEVVAVSEKVIVKLDDLMKWTCSDFSTWTRGLGAVSLKPSKRKELRISGQKEALHHYRQCTLNSGLSFKDVLKEKADLGAEDDDDEDGDDADNTKIIVLSYPQYCRYRTMLKRIQNRSSSWLVDQFVMALGGIAIFNESTRILYCRDTFDHPTLIESESVCDELALNLKGRPRKKKACSQKRDAQVLNGLRDSNEDSDGKSNPKSKCELKTTMAKPKNNNNCKSIAADEKSKVATGSECRGEEQAFLVALYKYMKERNTPIERIPYLGFKQINLWTMFQAAQNLGGYELITARRQWKQIYDELGGNPGSTSAATCTRRHYERLILPYERYIKGEEDKPLPPVKPRKQENSPQETESKMKAAGTKRKNEQIRKGKKEKDTTQRMKENCEATSVPEGTQEMDVARETLVSVPEGVATSLDPEVEEQQSRDLTEGADARTGQPKDNDDKASDEQPDGKHGGITPSSGKEAATAVQRPEEGQMGTDTSTSGPNPESPPCPADLPASDVQEETAANAVPAEGETVLSVQVDQSRKEETESRPGSNPLPGAQRQHARQPERVNPNLPPCPHKEKEEVLASTKNDACSSYMPVVYSRGHPGIMSPLAKKKLLSQVSGTLPNNYSIGAPPPLLSSKKVGDNGEELVKTECSFSQGSSSDLPAVNRPSVIQRAHSVPKRSSDERGEAFKHDGLNKLSDSETAYLPNHHLNCSDSFKGGAHYPFTSDLPDNENKSSEKKCCPPSQVSSFLVDFYSSPHLHNLYKHTEHHLNDQTSKYHNVAKNKSSSFMQRKNQDAEYLSYLSNLHQPEKKFGVKSPAEEQPTDLSLPKLKKMLPRNVAGTPLPSSVPLDAKSTTAGTQPTHSNCNPKACRVPPMPMVASAKTGEAIPSSPAKLEEAVRPIVCSKASSQVIGTTKPIKRNREGTDSGNGESPEKKHRAVSPISKDPTMKEKTFDLDGEGSKALPPGIFLEGHKFPLPTPIFPGVYPGAFVSQVQDMCDGLSSHFPVDYAHPLQYLKNQAVLSPLMQPLAIHSFMIPAMQRQILASTGASPQLYRHLSAAATPVAATYGDILHHSLYPLGSLNPQVAYSSSPISSLHPSTKL